MEFDANKVSAIAAAFAAVFAAVSAWLSWRALKQNAKSLRASMLLAYREAYRTDEMLEDVDLLVEWKQEHGDAFAHVWKTLMDARDPRAQRINAARRRVAQYFVWIADLYGNNLIDRSAARALTDLRAINVLYVIVEPLDALHDRNYKKKKYDLLRSIRPSYHDD